MPSSKHISAGPCDSPAVDTLTLPTAHFLMVAAPQGAASELTPWHQTGAATLFVNQCSDGEVKRLASLQKCYNLTACVDVENLNLAPT